MWQLSEKALERDFIGSRQSILSLTSIYEEP
jgi:hypothetical protein